MPTHQKKPKKVDAYRWDGSDHVPAWARGALDNGDIYFLNLGTEAASMKVRLLSGRVGHMDVGDWLLREDDANSLIYPMKADAFEKYYEAIPA